MTKLVWPKQTGRPLIPLSPHNQEISDEDSKDDLELLDQKAQERKRQRKLNGTKGVKFISKIAQRIDDEWEMRVWNTINSNPWAELKWEKCIKNEIGERTFQSSKLKIRVLCDLESPSSWLISPGRRTKYEWVTFRVGKECARPQDIGTMKSLLAELAAEQSKLRESRHV